MVAALPGTEQSIAMPLNHLQRDARQLIDGQMVGSDTSFEVINPATGTAFALCPQATRTQLDEAVRACGCAFDKLAAHHLRGAPRTDPPCMGAVMRDNADMLAALLTREQASRCSSHARRSRARPRSRKAWRTCASNPRAIR